VDSQLLISRQNHLLFENQVCWKDFCLTTSGTLQPETLGCFVQPFISSICCKKFPLPNALFFLSNIKNQGLDTNDRKTDIPSASLNLLLIYRTLGVHVMTTGLQITVKTTCHHKKNLDIVTMNSHFVFL